MVTGWGLDSGDMLHCAESVVQAKKEFNIACGWTPVEDTLPSRMLTSALEADHKASLTSDTLNSLIRAYNLERGWDENRFPIVTGDSV